MLSLGQPISGHLTRDQTRSFQIVFADDELVDVRVIQHEANVVVRLFDPADTLLIELDKLTGITRPERLVWIADEPGPLRLEIAAHDDTSGAFEIVLEQRRSATSADRQRLEAEKAFSKGRKLAGEKAKSDAIMTFQKALELFQELEDGPRQADVLYRLGRLHHSQRDKQRALEVFEQTLEVLEQAPDPWQAGSVHHWLGYIFRFKDMGRARDHYFKALSLRQSVDFAGGTAQTHNNLGLILLKLGEPQQALEHYESALSIWLRIEDRVGEARTLHNRGRCYISLGLEEEALDDLERALEIRLSLGDVSGQAITLNAIGQARNMQGEAQEAFEAFRRARELRERSGDLRGQAVTLVEIGELHHRLGRPDQAYAAYEQALDISTKIEDRLTQAYALHGLGRVQDFRDRPAEALQRYRMALDRFEAIQDRPGRVMTLGSMSLAEQHRGRWPRARSLLESALSVIEQQRIAVASHALRYSFFATKQTYYHRYVNLLMEQHRQEPSAGYDAEALAASERARARSQLEALVESGADLRRGVEPQHRARERQLEQQLQSAERQRQWMLEEGANEKRLAQIERKLRDLFREYSRIQGEIRLASPGYAALTQPRSLSSEEIQRRAIDSETLLLEFDLGPERSYLWVVSTETIHSFVLAPEAELEKVAKRAYLLLGESDQTRAEVQTEMVLEKLSDMLLGQVTDLLADKRLLIVSQGALQYIPFSALPVPGEISTSQGSTPLGSRHEIVNMPSASMLAVLREQLKDRRPAEGLVAVLADPVFELDDPRVQGLPQANRFLEPQVRGHLKPAPRHFERLVFSQLEADRILALVPPEARFASTGFDADRDAVINGRFGDYRYLHFATHGVLNTEHPELSRLVLSRVAATGKPREDGSLFAHDIYDLELPAELVVLSACETALGAEIRGEGLLGLTQSFFYAGAARVIVSLWKVDDEATAELMTLFYQNLLTLGQKPGAALRNAQESIRQERRWRAPYYWAGFLLLGEWS